uniref:Uncharacterized protein n=1 Tax=Spongospora subterranea TaxID=70186 RepID=A0A0H5QN60_9EUKA|eukprot:CRZ03435.1 hypothetical protein [Spongospora subterranea]
MQMSTLSAIRRFVVIRKVLHHIIIFNQSYGAHLDDLSRISLQREPQGIVKVIRDVRKKRNAQRGMRQIKATVVVFIQCSAPSDPLAVVLRSSSYAALVASDQALQIDCTGMATLQRY